MKRSEKPLMKPFETASPGRISLRSGAAVPAGRMGAPRRQVIPPIRLSRILVPVDFSRTSVKPLCYASALAKAHGAKIVLYAHEANQAHAVGSHETADRVMRSAACPVLVVPMFQSQAKAESFLF